MEELSFPAANHAVELDVGAVQLFASGLLAGTDALHQLHALIAIEMAVVVIQIVELGLGGVLEFVVAPFDAPYVGPMR